MKTVEDMDGDNFINARIRPFHDTDQVCQKIRDPSTARIWSQGPENPVDASRYNISFSQCMKMTVLVEIITTNMATLETHFHRITMLMKTTFTKLIFICLLL